MNSLKQSTSNLVSGDAVVDFSSLKTDAERQTMSLKDVDIHSITDEVEKAMNNAHVGTWAFNPPINYSLFLASMKINENEHKITLNSLGTDAMLNGDSTNVTAVRSVPGAVKDVDYILNYQKDIKTNEFLGVNTTQAQTYDQEGYFYGGTKGNGRTELKGYRHNDIYTISRNLFYDDDEQLEPKVTNKISAPDPNSIINKTKRLFADNKMNTIISPFHTKKTSPYTRGTETTMDWGMSHGRNLLLKSAEENGPDFSKYNIHGYDNPYCRVWTHHYQYNRRDRLIRPFITFTDSERENTESTSIEDFHNFTRFNKAWEADGNVEFNKEKYGWKSGNIGWEMSVLHNSSKNGTVNIAPKYSTNSQNTISPINCMFSLENLAWQGYDPYSFQKALSTEQRGPMGGRIMWFPPYNLKFNESLTTNWQSHSFIGRGEEVYTYTNSKRSGSLSFTMLVDHPSYTDLALAHDGDIENGSNNANGNPASGVKDTDLLRFFAGCDSGIQLITPPHNDPPQKKKKENVIPDEDLLKFSFYVFYPNNYSGYWDLKDNTSVEPIAYLLAGIGAQKDNGRKSELDKSKLEQKRDKFKMIEDYISELTDNWNMPDLDELYKYNYTLNILSSIKNCENDSADELYKEIYKAYKNTNLSYEIKDDPCYPFVLYCGDYSDEKSFYDNMLINSDDTLLVSKFYDLFKKENESFFKYPSDKDAQKDFLEDLKDAFNDYREAFWKELTNTLCTDETLSKIKTTRLDTEEDAITLFQELCYTDKIFDGVYSLIEMQKSKIREIFIEYCAFDKDLYVNQLKPFVEDKDEWENFIDEVYNTMFENENYLDNEIDDITNGVFWNLLGNKENGIQTIISFVLRDLNSVLNATQPIEPKKWFKNLYKLTSDIDECSDNDQLSFICHNDKKYDLLKSYPEITRALVFVHTKVNPVIDFKSDMLPYETYAEMTTEISKKSKTSNVTLPGLYYTTDNGNKIHYFKNGKCISEKVEQLVDDVNRLNINRSIVKFFFEYLMPVYGMIDKSLPAKFPCCAISATESNDSPKIDLISGFKSWYEYNTNCYTAYKQYSPNYKDESFNEFLEKNFNDNVDFITPLSEWYNATDEKEECEAFENYKTILNEYFPISSDKFINLEPSILSTDFFSNGENFPKINDDINFHTAINPLLYIINSLDNIENSIKSLSAENNQINQDFGKDIPISFENLFESNGLGYEMMKFTEVKRDEESDNIDETYDDFRKSARCFGISGVRRKKDDSNHSYSSYTFTDDFKPENAFGWPFPDGSCYTDDWESIVDNHIKGTRPNWNSYKSNKYDLNIKGIKNWDGKPYYSWYYRIDGKYQVPTNNEERNTNYYDQKLNYYNVDSIISDGSNQVAYSNYRDSKTYGLNVDVEMVKKATEENDEILKANKEELYSLAEVAYVITNNNKVKEKIVEQGLLLEQNDSIERIKKLERVLSLSKGNDTIPTDKYRIKKIQAVGVSNSHANNASKQVNDSRNTALATNRADTAIKWLQSNLKLDVEDGNEIYQPSIVKNIISAAKVQEPDNVNDVSELSAKSLRCAKVTIYCEPLATKDLQDCNGPIAIQTPAGLMTFVNEEYSYNGSTFYPSTDGVHYLLISDEKKSIWKKDENGNMVKVNNPKTIIEGNEVEIENQLTHINNLRYDNENRFFRELQIKDPIVFSKLVDKLQVFDPAFHSMTPEGFNARLTFLNQCTRQGDTHTISDSNRANSPTNLAFGKAPYCVLRLGDFYHTMITINSINIDYEPLVLDLNTEGIGVQPMLANVSINFNFIGGSDMAGAVQRLQNAATFNYYANTRLYDNRADRVKYHTEVNKLGVIDEKGTYAHQVPYLGLDYTKEKTPKKNKPMKK